MPLSPCSGSCPGQRGDFGGSVVAVVWLRMCWKQPELFQLCQALGSAALSCAFAPSNDASPSSGSHLQEPGCLFAFLECSFSSCARGEQVISIWVRPSTELLSCRDISSTKRSSHNYQGTFLKSSGSFVLKSSLRCALGRLM